MERRAPVAAPETTTSPEPLDLSFAEVEQLDSLRKVQEEAAREARAQTHLSPTPTPADVMTARLSQGAQTPAQIMAARLGRAPKAADYMDPKKNQKLAELKDQNAAQAVEGVYTGYLDSHINRDDNPEAYDALKELFRTTSVTSMDPEKWYQGEADADGKHTKPETAGRFIAGQQLDTLRAKHAPEPKPAPEPAPEPEPKEPKPDDKPDKDDTSPEPEPKPAPEPAPEPEPKEPKEPKPPKPDDAPTIEIPKVADPERERLERGVADALRNLEDPRRKFAEVAARRSQMWRKRGSKPRKLEDEYLRLQEIYKRHEAEVGRAKALLSMHVGRSETEVRSDIMHALLDEHNRLGKEELDYLEKDKSLVARIGRKLAKSHRLEWLIGGTGVAAGAASTAVKGATGVGLMVAAPLAVAGVGALAAIQTAKGALTATVVNRGKQYKEFRIRHDKDHSALREYLLRILTPDSSRDFHEKALGEGITGYMEVVDGRVNTDIKQNGRRVKVAAAIGALATVGGEAAGLLAHHFDVGTHIANGWHNLTGNANAHGTPPLNPSVNPTDQAIHPKIPAHHHTVEGFSNHVAIKPGDGYQHVVHELAQQKHIDLTDRQSWDLWHHINSKFHGNIFTNDPSYHMGPGADSLGIAHPAKDAIIRDDVLRYAGSLIDKIPAHH